MFYCLISPNIPAKVFLKFFMVSSPSTPVAPANSSSPFSSTLFFVVSESFAAVVAATTPARSFLATSTFLTVELALLTPETELDASEAGKRRRNILDQLRKTSFEITFYSVSNKSSKFL